MDRWNNWIGDYGTAATIHRLDSIEKIMRCVSAAVEQGRRVRAVGCGHSFSPVAAPSFEGWFVDISEPSGRGLDPESRGLAGIRQDIDYRRSGIPLEAGEQLVRVMAGTRLKKLNRIHLPDCEPALGMINLGTFDGQTLAGAINTATHGTGLRVGSLADLVMSADIVTVEMNRRGKPEVRHIRVEPANGITDRRSFENDASRHGMLLYQDDDLFHSLVVGFGCVGIATSYVLRVRQQYWLTEEKSIVEYPVQSQRMGNIASEAGFGRFPREAGDAAHYWFLLNIAEMQGKKAKDEAACLVIRRNESPRTPLKGQGKEWPERRFEFGTYLGELLSPALGSARPTAEHNRLGGLIRKNYFKPQVGKEPFRHGTHSYASSISYIAHRRERDKSSEDKAPDPPPDAISTEISVPADQLRDALHTLVELARQSSFFYPIPWGVRFVAPSKHFLAANYGRPTAYIELPLKVTRTAGHRDRDNSRDEVLKPMLETLEQAVCYSGRFDARPHLGKYHSINRDRFLRVFPQAQRWLAIAQRFNPLGTFSNRFSDQIGLQPARPTAALRLPANVASVPRNPRSRSR